MKEDLIELLRMTTPFILLVINIICVPWLKKRYYSWLTFFSLPTNQQIDAIDYLQVTKTPSSSMENLKHKIKMHGFKLHEDVFLSKCIIRLYYENKSKNGYLAKNLIRARGMYSVKDDMLHVNWAWLFPLVFFGFFSMVGFYFSYKLFIISGVNKSNLVPAWSLLLLGIVYGFIFFNFTCQFVSILLGKGRFNKLIKNYLPMTPLNSVAENHDK
ncbi:hypothetical protein ACTW1T_000277 [Cronobacter sakazakii]